MSQPLPGDLIVEIVDGVLREKLPGKTAAELAREVYARIVRLERAYEGEVE